MGDNLNKGYLFWMWHLCPIAQAKDTELQVFATACYNLQRCVEIMDSGGLVLDEKDSHESSSCLSKFLVQYAWLAANFLEKRLMLFLFRPKHHCLYHQAVQLGEWRINQILFQTMDGRKLLGKIEAHFCGLSWGDRMFTHVLKVLAGTCDAFRRLSEI